MDRCDAPKVPKRVDQREHGQAVEVASISHFLRNGYSVRRGTVFRFEFIRNGTTVWPQTYLKHIHRQGRIKIKLNYL